LLVDFRFFKPFHVSPELPLAGMDGVKCFSIYPSKVQTDPEDAMIGISFANGILMGYNGIYHLEVTTMGT
jgi:hypothetical protein